jgi:hypothetical protein
MPFNGEVLRVVITVKEFEKPDASGHRLYTVHAVDIEGTPADTAVSRASSGLNRTPTSDAGVNSRFAQVVEIVKNGQIPMVPVSPRSIKPTVDAALLLGYEKCKGRDWLVNKGGSNSRRSQVNAALDEAIVYATDSLRNPSAFFRNSQSGPQGKRPSRLPASRNGSG